MAYYEDEDWYLRFRERLELYDNPLTYDAIIPRLKSVIRHAHKSGKWAVTANYIYFHLKWKRKKQPGPKTLHSRQNLNYQRRLPEPSWPEIGEIREAYGKNDFSKKEWKYSKPAGFIRILSFLTNNRFFTYFRNLK
jgi:hypothetical protein